MPRLGWPHGKQFSLIGGLFVVPKSKQFWSVRKMVAKIAGEQQLNLSHRALHRVTNAYMQQVQELGLGYDPKTYADPTGERAVRDWFAHWMRHESGLVAA